MLTYLVIAVQFTLSLQFAQRSRLQELGLSATLSTFKSIGTPTPHDHREG